MPITTIDSSFSVSKQIELSELDAIKRAGFKTVISNRPNDEEQGQPSAAVVEKAVTEAALDFIHQPVVSGKITDQDVEAFRQFLGSVEHPVFAFCRTGTRCTHLWALATVTPETIDEVISKAAAAGYDITALRPRLEAFAVTRG